MDTTRNRALCGMAGGTLFLTVLLIAGALRPGYDPVYQPGSALSLGDGGWIQMANFIVSGLLLLVFGTSLRRALGSTLGAVLIAILGASLALAGVFSMDPMRGFPPGTPPGMPAELSLEHQIHDLAGVLTFTSMPAACLVVAFRLSGGWRVYSVVNAVVGLALFFWFGTAYEADVPYAGLIQRVLITVDLSWVVLLAVRVSRTSRSSLGTAI